MFTKKSVVLIAFFIAAFAISGSAQTRHRRTSVKKPVRKTTTPAPVFLNAGAVKTPSGLIYMITKQGDGVQAKAGDTVSVHYTGLLTDGTKFDSSKDRGNPIEFPLGAGRVIKGWDEGIAKMRVGDQAILVIPSSIGYGPNGRGPIPGGATMVFIVELVGIKGK